MQRLIQLPDWTMIEDRRKPPEKYVTYQVALRSEHGIVLASDRLESKQDELGVLPANEITKIVTAGQFACAFSGSDLARTFCDALTRGSDRIAACQTLEEARILLDSMAPEICKEHTWRLNGKGPAEMMLLGGDSKSILFATLSPHLTFQPAREGHHISGLTNNPASFLIKRIHHQKMRLDAMAHLAAYAVKSASLFASNSIDGLDVAAYNMQTRKFEIVNIENYSVPESDQLIRDCLEGRASRLEFIG